MAICKFWEKGNCRNGDGCRFEHPGSRNGNLGRNQQFGGGGRDDPRSQPRNAFNAPRDDQSRGGRGGDSYRPEPRRYDDDRGRGQGFGGGGAQSSNTHLNSIPERNFRYDEKQIRADLTTERPEWPFSTYAGTATDVPKHFFPPEMEQSPEECRYQYYLLRAQGQEAQAVQAEGNAHGAALAAVDEIRKDVLGAIRKIAPAKREHPNRWDIVDANPSLGSSNPFLPAPLTGAQNNGATPSPGFGQPSNLGPGANAFAQAGGFGQPSQIGQQSSGFGQPSQVGQQSAFGQPSQPGAAAFGQASQLGQQNPFAQASQPQGASGFGQPSTSSAPSTFGQPSAAGPGSAFGQPSAVGFGNPSPLGQSGAFANKPNPFGGHVSNGPSAFGQQPVQANVFGGQPAQANAFSGQPTQTNAFGGEPTQANSFGGQPVQANSFGGQPAQANPFGQASQSAFGQQQGQSAEGHGQPLKQQAARGFGQPSGGFAQPSQGFGAPTQTQNALVGARAMTNGLQQPSLQINTAGSHMNGTYTTEPQSATPQDSDPPDEMYGSRKGEYEQAYRHVLATGTFVDGVMPEIAPLHGWVGWGVMERKFKA